MFALNETGNITSTAKAASIDEPMEESTFISHSTIASIGIVTNFTVIAVFLSNRKLRKKIPNIFIINQVSSIGLYFVSKLETQKLRGESIFFCANLYQGMISRLT